MDILYNIQIFLENVDFLFTKVLKDMNSHDFGIVILLDKDLECGFLCC